MPFKYRSEPLFNSGVLDMEEFQKRMEFWISYGKTGASKDVEVALDRLTILAKSLQRDLIRKDKEATCR